MARKPEPARADEVELPVPAHPTAWASLVYAIATLALAYPALAGKFLINLSSDQYKAGYQFRDFAAQSLRSGHGIPQWEPFLQGGMPYVAAMHGDIFYPTALLRMILPTDVAMTWEFPIHLFLCGLFTFLFLRAWRFGFYASLAGGLAYMLGGSIAGYASPGHDGKLFVSTMLPLALLLLTRGIRDDKLWAWGALAVTIGLAVLSPHPQLLQYLLLTGGAFALYVAFADHPGIGRLPRSIALKRLGYAAGAVALGMLIGAVQYWPAIIEYKPWSPRASGHTFDEATSFSFPIEETLNWYLPQFSGILGKYWGRNGIHLHSDYFGAVALVLAGAAFGRTGQKSFRRFWIATGIVSLLWAYGGNTPFFTLILAVVPGTRYFRAPSTIIYITAFSVAVLAAFGMERILARRVSPRYVIGWAVGGAALAILLSVGGYAALVNVISDAKATMYAPPEQHAAALAQFSQQGMANASSAILGAWRSLLFVLIAVGVIWMYITERLAAKSTAIALAALLAVDLVSIERMYWMFSDPASQLFASDPAIDSIKADMARTGSHGRVLTLDSGPGIRPLDANFRDALWTHGLRIPTGYHGNELGLYQRLVSLDGGNVVLTPQFWRHENVQYLYTGVDERTLASFDSSLSLPAPFARLAGPVRDAAGSTVYAYRIPVRSSTAWVTAGMVKAPENDALAAINDPRFDPARVAVIDTSATQIQTPPLGALPEPATTQATVTAMSPGSYDISLQQPAVAGQALVVSDNYFPGWQATADGKPAPVARADYNLIGIALPAGGRSIQLRFTDAAYQKGKVVTIIAVLAACLLWVLGYLAQRSRRDVAPALS
jgi:hypothetical protein